MPARRWSSIPRTVRPAAGIWPSCCSTRAGTREAFPEYDGRSICSITAPTSSTGATTCWWKWPRPMSMPGTPTAPSELLDRAVRVPDWYRWIRAWACFNARDYRGAIRPDQRHAQDLRGRGLCAGYPASARGGLCLCRRAETGGRCAGPAGSRAQRLDPGTRAAAQSFTNDADRAHWREGMRRAGFAKRDRPAGRYRRTAAP